MAARFVRIVVEARDAAGAERAALEAFEAGASGIEERDVSGTCTLLVYAPAARAAAVQAALVELGGAGVRVGAPAEEPAVDWSRRWRAGLVPLVISPRLAIVPEGEPFEPAPGQAALRIGTGQAFGTGGHASTRLALELLDGLPDAERRGAHVLDVGSGTGVLALAALRLGAATAVGCDLDPLAVQASRENAARAGLAPRLAVFRGSLEALAGPRFTLVLANLLRTELLPLVPALGAALRPGGVGILSGLLGRERPEVERALAAAGLTVRAERGRLDADDERWIGLEVTR